MKKLFTLLLLIQQIAFATEFYPANIYQVNDKLSHHVFVVEKSTHKLHIFKNTNGEPTLLRTFDVATGKMTGNKFVRGDKKTPEGVYFLGEFYSSKYLTDKHGDYGKIYGAGAFTINYPNLVDKRNKKRGGGIWLHSTDNDKRVEKGLDSKGCVVATDSDIKEISKYIDLPITPIVIVQNMTFLSKEAWTVNKNTIQNLIITWANSWKQKDLDTYISQYSKDQFYDKKKGNYNSYKRYKRSIFRRNDAPVISFSNVSILQAKDYVVVTMVQSYNSKTINDIGRKTLYLKKDNQYNWKIIAEKWTQYNDTEMAFIPTDKYFKQDI